MTAGARPRLVLSDLDGVLAHYDREHRVAYLAGLCGADPARLWAALYDGGLETDYEAGRVGTADYLDRLGGLVGCTVTAAQWAESRRVAMRVEPATLDTLDRLARSAQVAILTNNGPLLAETLHTIVPELATRFGGRVLCSGSLGARKPDADAYLRALAVLGQAPGETLFLDDHIGNVAGARAAGLQAEAVRAPDEVPALLARHGLA